MLGVGLVAFLFSKEIWLYEHQFTHFLAFWLAIYVIVKKFGARTKKYLDNYDEVSSSLCVRQMSIKKR